jgi:hypothetical protein
MSTDTQTDRWAARGFTDDVTQCERCGKPELKGTVRMVIVDADGGEGDDTFMGVTCAARMTGRKASEIRTEARAADTARREAEMAAFRDHNNRLCALRDEWLTAHGHNLRVRHPGFAVVSEALAWAKAQMI